MGLSLSRRVARRLKRSVRSRVAPLRPSRLLAHDDRFWQLVARDQTIERLAGRFRFTEGPIWRPTHNDLLFSDIPANRIYSWDGRQTTVFREPSNHANGMTLAQDGSLLICEHGARRVARLAPDGVYTVLADQFEGQPLNSPNDIVVNKQGDIFFTDPPFGIRPNQQQLPFQGVFRLRANGALTLLIDDMIRPNGLAFSADETRLYVDDSANATLRVYDIDVDGTLFAPRTFCQMGQIGGNPDGMKVDRDGNVYCTGPGGVWVLTPRGEQLGIIATGEQPANCAWGDSDRRTLFITARTSLYKIRLNIPGAMVTV